MYVSQWTLMDISITRCRTTIITLVYYGLSELYISYDLFYRCCLHATIRDYIRLESQTLSLDSLVNDADKAMFGASHISTVSKKTRLSKVASRKPETNHHHSLTIMLCTAGTLLKEPFRRLLEQQSYMYFRHTLIGVSKAHLLDWASCMTVILRVPLPHGWDFLRSPRKLRVGASTFRVR
jgi:hypothetical protein